MNFIRRFMYGRYGSDALSWLFFILYLLLNLTASIWRSEILAIIAYLPLLLCFMRIFSRNTSKRFQENQKFLSALKPLTHEYLFLKRKWKDRKFYKYFKCPKCKRALRVPRGKGKVEINCSGCHHRFIKKS